MRCAESQLFRAGKRLSFEGNRVAEYHGWAVAHTGVRFGKGPEAFEAHERGEDALFQGLKEQVGRLDESVRNCFFFNDGFNGMRSVMVTGRFNHRRDPILDIFRWLAERGPGSHGLLYVSDDEDP